MLKSTRRIITGIKDGHSALLADETVNTLIPYPQYPWWLNKMAAYEKYTLMVGKEAAERLRVLMCQIN
jgi:hypothetical protein